VFAPGRSGPPTAAVSPGVLMRRDRGAQRRPHVLSGHSILLVEDVEHVRQLLVEALGRDGFAVHEAASVAQAWQQLPFAEIVLSDLELSDGSGVELIGAALKRFPELPVVAMSGNPALLTEATKSGALAVLAKQFDLDQLGVVTTLAAVAATVRRG
jgi:DNA-binding NtrC family response regulator